jgi:DNA-binding response OmpR family regulator
LSDGKRAPSSPTPAAGVVRRSEPAPPNGRTVLVVDDDRDATTMIRRFLEQHGYRVVVVNDPRSAMDRCLDARPALVIVDLMMPHLDGEGFVRQLRGVLREGTPPILLVSASSMRTDIQKRLALPASLAKPFAMDELLAFVTASAGPAAG